MNLKPALKNGQQNNHDTSKTSSEQQPASRKPAPRPNHATADVVAKRDNGGHHTASYGASSNGHTENGRGQQASGLAAQNGNQGRPNGHVDGGVKPRPAAAGAAVPSERAQPNGGLHSAAKLGGKPNHNGPNGANANGYAAGSRPATVPPTPGGGRGRDASAAGSANPTGGAAAAGDVTNGTDRQAREPRRRGGRGRGGGAGGEAGGGAAAGGDGDGGAADRAAERLDKSARSRGDRRPRGVASDGTEGVAGGDGSAAGGAAAGANIEQGDNQRGGQRGGKPRGRRGRGGQAGVGDHAADQATEQQRTTVGTGGEPEQKLKQQRQRPVRVEPRPPRGPAEEQQQEGGVQPVGKEPRQQRQLPPNQPQPDGQQQGPAGKQERQRKVREPRPPSAQQQLQQGAQQPRQKPQGGLDVAEQTGDDAVRGGRGQGRGGRRRNGGVELDAGGGAERVLDALAGQQHGMDADVNGGDRSQRPEPQPNDQQQQAVDQGKPVSPRQQAVPSAPPAPAALQQQYQEQVQQQVQAAAHMQQHQEHVVVQQYQRLSMQEAPQGYQQQVQQHVVPQQQYQQQHPEYQQQYMQQTAVQQQQYQQTFQQYQHQQLLQHQQQLMQHQQQAAPAHAYGTGEYTLPGGPHAGAPMQPPPPYYNNVGANGYGQMPPPAFAHVPALPAPLAAPGGVGAMPQYMPAPVASQQEQQHFQHLHHMHSVAACHMVQQGPQQQQQVAQYERQAQQQQVQQQAVPAQYDQQAQQQQVQQQGVPVAVASSVVELEVPPAAEPVVEAPAVEAVKNEWADRLAQQALARMNAVKSNLLNGGGSRSTEGLQLPPSGRPPVYSSGSGPSSGSPRGPPPASGGGAAAGVPDAEWRGASDVDAALRRSGGDGAEPWRGGPGADPTGNGWRSGLAPTGAADAAEAWRMRGGVGGDGDRLDDGPSVAPYMPPRRDRDESPPPSGARPRLNLQPRTKPLQMPVAAAVAAAVPALASSVGSDAARSNTIFGAAKPREEVLRQRGVNEPPERGRLTSGNLPSGHGAAPRPHGPRAGSVGSGASDEDAWHTVGKGGKGSKPPGDVGNALLDAYSDPFFTGRNTNGHGVAIVGRGMPVGGFGSYGSGGKAGGGFMNSYGASRGYGANYEDDEPIFKRGLPTRQDAPF